MTLSSSSFDNNAINMPQSSIEQMESTAARELPKLALGIHSSDTMKPFSDIDKQNTWKYSTNSGHPTLAMLSQVRSSGKDAALDDQWKAFFHARLNSLTLPDDVKTLLEEMTKPLEEGESDLIPPQYEKYLAFAIALQYVAKAEYWISHASTSIESDSSLKHASLNALVPEVLLNNMVNVGREFITLAEEAVKDLTPNHPDYDELNHDLDHLKAGYKNLGK